MSGSKKPPCPFKGEFRNFLWLVWTQALNLPEPTPLQYSIAHELQYGWRPDSDGITRIQLQASRHFGKTYILCAYVIWCLLRDPDEKIVFISMNKNRAEEAISLMRQIIDALDMCEHMRPRDGQRDGAQRFDIGSVTRPSKDPSVAAYGIGSAIAGTHPKRIIADDCETKENARTALLRDRLWLCFMEFENLINPGGMIIHMGTPQSGDSVYNKLAKDYHLRRWPCRFVDPDGPQGKHLAEWMIEKVREDPSLIGKPSNPLMFGEEQLLKKQSVMGDFWYTLQMMLDTTLSDSEKYPLKLSDLIVMSCHYEQAPVNIIWGNNKPIEIQSEGFGSDRLYAPDYFVEEFRPYQKAVMFIDPAGSGGDEVGYAVVKSLNGFIFVLDCGGLPGGHSEATLTKLAKIAFEYGIKDVVVETNFGDGLYEKALAPIMAKINGPTKIRSKRASGKSKEERIIDILQPVMSVHRLVVNMKAAKNKDLMYQLTHITRIRGCLKEDGAIDALAGAVAEFADLLALDPESQEAKRKEAERKRVADDFERAFRNPGNASQWFKDTQNPSEMIPDRRVPKQKRWGVKRRWSNV